MDKTKSLYQQYRSHTFDDVVEQSHIVPILKHHVSEKISGINYIFHGPRGTGKTSCARIFARALNCLSPIGGNPCGTCANCVQTDPENGGSSFDIIEIDAASNTGVDNVRDVIIDNAQYGPTGGMRKKVYIIDEVHMLSKSAFNALLKIMEEPPEYLVFILATTEIHKVIETILSRCQIFQFHHISRAGIAERLRMIANKEQISITDEAIESIGKLAQGCMRDAIKYLDQVSGYGQSIDVSHVVSAFGIASDTEIADIVKAIEASPESSMQIVEQMLARGVQMQRIIDDLLAYMHTQHTTPIYHKVIAICLYVRQHARYFPTPGMAWLAGCKQ